MKTITQFILIISCLSSMIFTSCDDGDFGANQYDPNTPITVSQLPKVLSFTPIEGKEGDLITITGVNFTSATNVTFGGKAASSFEIIDDATIEAVVSSYGSTGAVAVTNHKGTRSLEGFLFIREIDPTENPNLALNGYVTATTAVSGSAANINDDNDKSWWQAMGNDNEWVKIDLGKLYSINTVVMTWDKNAAGTDCDLMISEDDVNYTTIYTIKNWDAVSNDGINKVVFDNTNARYVKLANMKNSATPYNMTLFEVEVYNTPPAENLALQKIAAASSNEIGASNAVYGSTSFVWQAGGNSDEWFKVDLGKVYTINNVIIQWDPGAYATDCEIFISQDNEEYTSVYSITGWDSSDTEGIQDMTFDNADARYVKAILKNGATPWNMTIKEFEVYKQW
ncbi:discoidin domain-containing protein [Bacteroides zhangwenhongii]|uniref:discoidin domain-containing protein n=1 Tax=Bacteroides zhangwenhongii TaxID=2650157 RepID=UPI003AAF6D16